MCNESGMRNSLGTGWQPGVNEDALGRKLGEMQRNIETLQRRVAELVQDRRDRAHDEWEETTR